MPPRSAKKSTGPTARKGAAAKKTTATKSSAASSAAVVEPAAEEMKVEERPAVSAPGHVAETVVKEEEAKNEKAVEFKVEETNNGGSTTVKDEEVEEDVKEHFEQDRGERLELDDNEPEYEAEEEYAVEYDEKELEHDDGHEGDDAGEDMEGVVADDEEADLVYEEVDVGEEDGDGEGEGDNEHIVEEHDVEEEEHHDIVKEQRKRKEFEVFVGGLDKDATEDDLRKVFSQVGEITEVRLMMNPHTKKNKGFAFLQFATVEQAKRAVSELKNPVVHGKQCGVAPSQDSDTLFLGNICKTWTKEHLKEKLKAYGVENIEDITLVDDTNEDGKNRGFAFLEFSSRSDAMDAFRRLQKRDVVFGVDRPAKVSFADSYVEPDDEIMAQVKTVFIDGINAAWDEDHVKEFLKKYGEVVKVELARNMPAAKRKDFGFVSFDTHDSAVKCAESINNSELGEGDNKVKVRARLSRPLQRGRGKRGIGGDYRYGQSDPRGSRAPWAHLPPTRRFPLRAPRLSSSRGSAISSRGLARPPIRDRRPPIASLDRPRRLPPPERPYDRRLPPPMPAYPRSSSRRDYGRHDEIASRSRVPVDYGARVPPERKPSYREDYSSRGSAYSDIPPRDAPRVVDRRPYADEVYVRKVERSVPAYREVRVRDYDALSGSKRPYSAMDEVPRYADVSLRHSRARLDYGVGGSSGQYDDVYGERLGRSHMEYGSSRGSLSAEGPHGLYSSRQGMSYGGGSVSGSDIGGMYSSNFGGSYISRGSDVGGASYSSLYSGRSMHGGGGYPGHSSSGSYY